MKTIIAIALSFAIPITALAQVPSGQQQKPPEVAPEDVIRITTALVQTDVVVTDKNDRVIPDLKLSDFELYENGKRQEIKFLEFVNVDADSTGGKVNRREEGQRPEGLPLGAEVPRDVSANEIRRVLAFVIDDLTIPAADITTVRQMLQDFVDNKMRDGDLVAIIRV